MHSVIANILNRKDRGAPWVDGRHIALVLFGGVMVGARGAGALVALQEVGLTNAFDEIYTMSSGFINGSSFLSKQAREAAAFYYQELSGRKFLNPFRIWKVADIDYVLRVIEKKSLDVKTILQNETRLYCMLVNTSKEGRYEYLEVHNFNERDYHALLKASFSLRALAGGIVQIGEDMYRDIIKDDAITCFFEHILESEATDMLVIYNYPWQRNHIHKKFSHLNNGRIFEVSPAVNSRWVGFLEKFARFDTRSSILKRECQVFGDETKKIFGSAEPVSLI